MKKTIAKAMVFFILSSMKILPSSRLEITQELMRMRTTADRPDELKRAINYVTDLFSPHSNLYIKHFLIEEKPSIVISTKETLTPDVLMMGHLDVVPAPEHLFEPKIKNGILYGRGACDMKSEITVMIDLMIRASKQQPTPNIALMLTCDEETGGKHGAGHLINNVGYRPKTALVPDGGENPQDIIISNKGSLHLRLTTKGISAHASRPWLGKNAILEIIDAYHRIEKLFPATEDPARWYITCSLNVLHAGTATNIIPCTAEAHLDIRFPESEHTEKLLEKIREAASPATIDLLASAHASLTSPEHEEIQKFVSVIKKTTGENAHFEKSHGANDGRYLTAHGIPVIVSRPKSGCQHSDEEWVDIESIETFHEMYRMYLGIL